MGEGSVLGGLTKGIGSWGASLGAMLGGNPDVSTKDSYAASQQGLIDALDRLKEAIMGKSLKTEGERTGQGRAFREGNGLPDTAPDAQAQVDLLGNVRQSTDDGVAVAQEGVAVSGAGFRGTLGSFGQLIGLTSQGNSLQMALLTAQTIAGGSGGGGGIGGLLQMGLSLIGGGNSTIPMQPGGGYAAGGLLSGPGTGASDDILLWGSNGEFMVNADATKEYRGLLERINSGTLPKFANGGIVGNSLGLPSTAALSKARRPQSQSVFNINVTGDVSRQTRNEIQQMIPQIAVGVNTHNYEQGSRR
jgi:hypothetical protein